MMAMMVTMMAFEGNDASINDHMIVMNIVMVMLMMMMLQKMCAYDGHW